MIDNLDLIGAMQQKLSELEVSVKHLRKTGTAYAEAEKAYKMALNKKALEMRDEGQAVGMINLIIYGQPEIAELRLKRDIAEVVYKANQEAINAAKIHINVLREQIEREWKQ